MDSLEKILKAREHVSFGKTLTPLITMLGDHSDPPPLPDPDKTGTIDSGDIETLYEIAIYPIEKWNLDPSNNQLSLSSFTSFANLKTQNVPSYYSIYLSTIGIYHQLVSEIGKPAALEYMYNPNPSTPPPPDDWDSIRYWSIQEFLNLLIVNGNFKTYDWLNFPGYMGGPYNNPDHLPYRPLNS